MVLETQVWNNLEVNEYEFQEALAEGNTASNNNPVRVAELQKKVGEPIEKATPAPVTPAPVQTDAKVPEPVTLTSSDFISKFPGIAEEMKAQKSHLR